MTGFLRQTKLKPRFEPRSEQIRGMELIVKGGARLFLKPGRGKTTTTLKAFQILKKMGLVDALLVVGPLRVVTTSWPQDIEKWADFEDLRVSLIHGGPEARRKAMATDADVYLMNVEGLGTGEWKRTGTAKVANKIAKAFLTGKRFMLAVDESTRFKGSQTERFKTMKRYLPFFERVVILTGTPQPNNLEDLFAQCYLTDQGADLGQFITDFRNEYMQLGYDGKLVPQTTGPKRVAEKIAATTLQLEDEEIVPVERIDLWLPMPDCIKEQYAELREEFLTEIEGKTIMAPNTGVLFGKLRQLAQGALLMPPTDEYVELHTAKLDKLAGLLEELNGEPLFCLYSFRHDFERINRMLGREVPRIGGGVSAARGAEFCRAFGAGLLPLLLGHPQSVALGVDGLQQSCKTMCWFGQDWSWELNFQAERRIVRHGTKADSVTIYRLLVDCSIEHALLRTVREKQLSEADFLQLLRETL